MITAQILGHLGAGVVGSGRWRRTPARKQPTQLPRLAPTPDLLPAPQEKRTPTPTPRMKGPVVKANLVDLVTKGLNFSSIPLIPGSVRSDIYDGLVRKAAADMVRIEFGGTGPPPGKSYDDLRAGYTDRIKAYLSEIGIKRGTRTQSPQYISTAKGSSPIRYSQERKWWGSTNRERAEWAVKAVLKQLGISYSRRGTTMSPAQAAQVVDAARIWMQKVASDPVFVRDQEDARFMQIAQAMINMSLLSNLAISVVDAPKWQESANAAITYWRRKIPLTKMTHEEYAKYLPRVQYTAYNNWQKEYKSFNRKGGIVQNPGKNVVGNYVDELLRRSIRVDLPDPDVVEALKKAALKKRKAARINQPISWRGRPAAVDPEELAAARAKAQLYAQQRYQRAMQLYAKGMRRSAPIPPSAPVPVPPAPDVPWTPLLPTPSIPAALPDLPQIQDFQQQPVPGLPGEQWALPPLLGQLTLPRQPKALYDPGSFSQRDLTRKQPLPLTRTAPLPMSMEPPAALYDPGSFSQRALTRTLPLPLTRTAPRPMSMDLPKTEAQLRTEAGEEARRQLQRMFTPTVRPGRGRSGRQQKLSASAMRIRDEQIRQRARAIARSKRGPEARRRVAMAREEGLLRARTRAHELPAVALPVIRDVVEVVPPPTEIRLPHTVPIPVLELPDSAGPTITARETPETLDIARREVAERDTSKRMSRLMNMRRRLGIR